ncbi:MAG TPA: hypothetical protein VJM15_09360 [Sphingomicrobium sp.]|nr:hypothetical protein [Sphingomicrobium sp.]
MVFAAGCAAIVVLGAAQRPAALAQTRGGVWEISGLPGARTPPRLCIADTAVLAQFEHRDRACTRVVISDALSSTVIHYTCPGGGFGRTKLTLLTPRSLRIETQGISNDLPFNYVLQARRVGECGPRQSAAAH